MHSSTQNESNDRGDAHARAEQLANDEPGFDQNEGLDEEDKAVADSFPASDPPAGY